MARINPMDAVKRDMKARVTEPQRRMEDIKRRQKLNLPAQATKPVNMFKYLMPGRGIAEAAKALSSQKKK